MLIKWVDMEDQLKQYLEEFVSTLKKGNEFAQEQLPLFVQEYLQWGFWEAIFLSILFLVIAIFGILIARYTYRKYKENDPYDEFGYFLCIALSCLVSFGTFVSFIGNVMTVIKVSVAPRVYLIENLMDLL